MRRLAREGFSMRMRISAVAMAAGAMAAASLGAAVPSEAATPAPAYTLVLGPAINDNGVIVGDDGIIPGLSLLGLGNGFIYQNGKATELNTLITPTPNVRLAGATGINNAGDIVGIADVTQPDGTQVSEGYELVPITS